MRGPRTPALVAALALCGGCSLFLGDDSGDDAGGDPPSPFGTLSQSLQETTTASAPIALTDGELAFISVITQQLTPSSAIGVRIDSASATLVGTHVAGGHSLQVFVADPGPGTYTAFVEFPEMIPSLVSTIPITTAPGDFIAITGDGLTAPASLTVLQSTDSFALCTFAGVSDTEPAINGPGQLWRAAFDGSFQDAKGWTIAVGGVGTLEARVDFLGVWAGLCAAPRPAG